MPLRVLIVCSANVCRSPSAVALLSHGLADAVSAGDVELTSAGIRPLPGSAPCPQALSWLARRGIAEDSLAQHHARQVSASLAISSDLILTMDQSMTGSLRRMLLPHDVRSRTFTLIEGAALAGHVVSRRTSEPGSGMQSPWASAELVTDLVQEMNACRGLASPPDQPRLERVLLRTGGDHWTSVPDAHPRSARLTHHRVLTRLASAAQSMSAHIETALRQH